jgi:hypothetical protein
MSRTLRSLAALAMLAVIVAGCSNGSAGNGNSRTTSNAGTTSSSGTTSNSGPANSSGSSTTAASDNSTATPREKAVKFAECMRENGYPDFPDPKASGEFPTFGISVSPAVWTKALGACKELQPPGSFSAHLSPKQLSAALKFARCIRANGVKDFPDPVNGQPLVDTTRIPSAATPAGMSILNAAMQKCRDLGDEAVAEATGGK